MVLGFAAPWPQNRGIALAAYRRIDPMQTRLRTLAAALLLALPLTVLPARAQQAGGLQQRMGAADFKAAGLDKLSPQELAHLEAWLAAHPEVKVREVTSAGKPVFYAGHARREKFEAHIAGHFAGWSGHNQFTLDNGQVWKQVGADEPQCMSADNPRVKLKPSIMGSWLMYVVGCNDNVHVERVR